MVSFSGARSSPLARTSRPVCACARITYLCALAMHCRLPYEGPRRISSYAVGVIEIALRTGTRPPPRESAARKFQNPEFSRTNGITYAKEVTL